MADPEAWLLDGDSAQRWQTLRDPTDAPPDVIARARGPASSDGLTRRLLEAIRDDGWGTANDWAQTLERARLIVAIAPIPEDPEIGAAMSRLGSEFRWDDSLGGRGFYLGETEPCINGGALLVGSMFGQPDATLANRLLAEQLADGGWNCEAENGSTRSSFDTTICVLEGLTAYRDTVDDPLVAEAITRGQEYLWNRGLLRRLSNGTEINKRYSEPTFPQGWAYDILRALDYMRGAGAPPDARGNEAIERVRALRDDDGRWSSFGHDDRSGMELSERTGQQSRWITLRALRVLRWFEHD